MDHLADRSSRLEIGSGARSEARERPRVDTRPGAGALAASALALGLWRGLRSPRASAPGAAARASGDRSGTPAAWIREILS
jgi:hypothetical protein